MKYFLMMIMFLLVGLFLFKSDEQLIDLTNYSLSVVRTYAQEHHLELEVRYEESEEGEQDIVLRQEPAPQTKLKAVSKLVVVIGQVIDKKALYQKYQVNELGKIPIIMYHGIIDLKDDETFYVGGNVDQDGYNRTTESFRRDLAFYYEAGYRGISLKDYIAGKIKVELGKSPLILTFDDGNENNMKVLGVDEQGDLIIDPNCAVGILETYKSKYPDFGITATFFLNETLFQQPLYNERILTWLIAHGYDIGNHTQGHLDFTKVTKETAQASIAYMYQRLDEIIPQQFIPVLALPFGSPYTKDHPLFPYILAGETYQTLATLRVGWEPELSPFHRHFDQTFLKRVRAFDNNGEHFDLASCFKILERERYIADGDETTIVVPLALARELNPCYQEYLITY